MRATAATAVLWDNCRVTTFMSWKATRLRIWLSVEARGEAEELWAASMETRSDQVEAGADTLTLTEALEAAM